MPTVEIMSTKRVRRTLRRLAYELVERNRGASTLELFGILKSGVPLAEALAEEIADIEGHDVPVHELDTTPFRDDQPDGAKRPSVTDGAPDVDGRDVILVDDVLFTGRTARAALDAVIQYGRPSSIQLVVLIDRGHREYPIQPDYVGRLIQTKHDEQVRVDTGENLNVSVED
ncbi:bifunctional pyr operon transcriptional regulator/uracil phosphoribosyltransferase [Longibacter salinarum]|uniref:Bifunctional protein PyrR n=1 Tax=Longibacter salinarum TaxID=1850348 RepID=A0A2A8CUR2_9BACT|nr:bifunctional pyr operon transcriptional regulator/uracil phosphoribosyltransferase PyrR [Longibacter salinarum]PEN12356.1 bifunctional pyr operon transcriptional regulator/uracil phosphoribosyltransferase [Longibacter salinarum]